MTLLGCTSVPNEIRPPLLFMASTAAQNRVWGLNLVVGIFTSINIFPSENNNQGRTAPTTIL